MLTLRVQNLLLNWTDPVVNARVYVNPPGGPLPSACNDEVASVTTDAQGKAELDIRGLLPGVHRLWIVPPYASWDPVGPRTATGPDINRIFRPFRIQFEVSRQNYVMRAWVHQDTISFGTLTVQLGNLKAQTLNVRLRPMWMKSPFFSDRGKKNIDMIVIHKTGDPVIGPAINQFLKGQTSAHYVVDRDGHVVKMVLEAQAAWHASHENAQDQSHWGTQTALAWRSIGIENVGTVKQGFTDAQYRSLIRLVQDLMRAHGIPRHRVVAHSDILTDGHGHMSSDRIACPGFQFEWSQLENANPPIGLSRNGSGGGPGDPVTELFEYMGDSEQPLVLKPGDFDPRTVGGKLQPARFGGRAYNDISQTPITQLQTWLSEIGYSVGRPDGVYSPRTANAVRHFKVHFEGRSDSDTINQRTAALIHAVRTANPKAD